MAKKGRCPGCGKQIDLILKGQKLVIRSHNIRILGEINPECSGTDKEPRRG
jgi:hypothetical protein